jgi:hypothetical protein
MTATRERDRSAGVVAVAGEALVEAAPGGCPANVAVGPDHAARAVLQRLLARTRDAITVSYEPGSTARMMVEAPALPV